MNTASAEPSERRSSLAISAQIEAEDLALKLVQSREVLHERQEIKARLLTDPAATTPDGMKTMQRALDDMAFAVAVIVAGNRDPDHPVPIWTTTASHEWFGKVAHGSGGGFDNPDSVYQLFPVDAASSYKITLRPSGPLPKMFSAYLYDSVYGDSKKHFDHALGGFHESALKAEPDGSYVITIGPGPANGSGNHIQGSPEARGVVVRNMLDDWVHQMPMAVEVHRTDGPPSSALNESEMARRTAEILRGHADNLILGIMRKNIFGSVSESNTVSSPFTRGGGWGYAARGTFNLKDDEALLVTVDSPRNQYLSIQITDPWLHSVESVRANGSLNNHQAEPNEDGSFSYVIAVRDPGELNWLDTDGLHEGGFLIRWQELPESIAKTAVREASVIKLSDVQQRLPKMTVLTSEQRAEQLRKRAQSYSRRYLPE